jgi:hypothetical protein
LVCPSQQDDGATPTIRWLFFSSFDGIHTEYIAVLLMSPLLHPSLGGL